MKTIMQKIPKSKLLFSLFPRPYFQKIEFTNTSSPEGTFLCWLYTFPTDMQFSSLLYYMFINNFKYGLWLRTPHSFWWEYNGESGMIRKSIIFRPYSLFCLTGVQNCVLHVESKGVLCASYGLLSTSIKVFLFLWHCRYPDPILQCQSF